MSKSFDYETQRFGDEGDPLTAQGGALAPLGGETVVEQDARDAEIAALRQQLARQSTALTPHALTGEVTLPAKPPSPGDVHDWMVRLMLKHYRTEWPAEWLMPEL